MTDDLGRRKELTFAQAEGAVPLPRPLKLREVSKELRALLWERIVTFLDRSTDAIGEIQDPWCDILRDDFVYRCHGWADEFQPRIRFQMPALKYLFSSGGYVKIFDFIQFVLRHRLCEDDFRDEIAAVFELSRAAYTIVDGDTICPIGSEEDATTIATAFASLSGTEFHGARQHLKNAADLLTAGKFAESIRESVHAVEAVARMLDPAAASELGPAISALESMGRCTAR
jgi:hypothetical protein